MRPIIFSISLLLSISGLTACGQSGALLLPSDQSHDKRAKYLLYKNEAVNSSASSELKSEPSSDTVAPIQQQFAAPAPSTTTAP
ncbi:MAG: lipoprotein [Acinetobacter sp.]